MTVALITESIVFLVVVSALLRIHYLGDKLAAEERGRLLNRVQRPDVLPITNGIAPFTAPDPEADYSELVGTITFEPEE